MNCAGKYKQYIFLPHSHSNQTATSKNIRFSLLFTESKKKNNNKGALTMSKLVQTFLTV